MSEFENRPSEGEWADEPRAPFWLTSWKVALLTALLCGGAVFIVSILEWPEGDFDWRDFRPITEKAFGLTCVAVLSFVGGWGLLAAGASRAAAVLSWLAAGLAALLLVLVLTDPYSLEIALTTRVLPGVVAMLAAVAVLTYGSTRMFREERRRQRASARRAASDIDTGSVVGVSAFERGSGAPFLLTPRIVAVSTAVLYLLAVAILLSSESPRVFVRLSTVRWARGSDYSVTPVLIGSLVVCFWMGWVLLAAQMFRAAVVFAWVALVLTVAMGFIAFFDGGSLDPAFKTSFLPGALLWVAAHVILTVGAMRIRRHALRQADQLRASLAELDRIGDVHRTRPAAPGPTTIADRKVIDGTTEQG